jgi:hypothetical protein
MAEITPDPIMRIAMGFMASKHLFVASAIGLFEALASGPATAEELAPKCGVAPRTLAISADAMLSLGLLEREEDRYCNSPEASAFLSGDAARDLRPMLRFWDRLSYPAWMKLEEAIRAEESRLQFFNFSADEQQIFSVGVEAFSAAAAAALATGYDFSQHHRVLDVAGGTGSFLIAILRRYPALQGTLFELPGACVVARHRLMREPEAARVSVLEGDMLADPLPDGHDVVLLANIVHGLSAAHNIALLSKVHDHVSTGARLLLVDLWVESGCGAVAVGRACRFPPLSSGGALVARP